jgi:hypothetical protein
LGDETEGQNLDQMSKKSLNIKRKLNREMFQRYKNQTSSRIFNNQLKP